MATLLLAMVVLAMLPVATMARGLLMPSLRPVLVLAMLGLDMDILVLDMLDMVVMDLDMLDMVLDMQDMVVMVLDMEDMVLDMAVPSMVKLVSYAGKSSKA